LQPLQKLGGYFALIFSTATAAPEQYLCIAGSESAPHYDAPTKRDILMAVEIGVRMVSSVWICTGDTEGRGLSPPSCWTCPAHIGIGGASLPRPSRTTVHTGRTRRFEKSSI
jgi:hypothetical protein